MYVTLIFISPVGGFHSRNLPIYYTYARMHVFSETARPTELKLHTRIIGQVDSSLRQILGTDHRDHPSGHMTFIQSRMNVDAT